MSTNNPNYGPSVDAQHISVALLKVLSAYGLTQDSLTADSHADTSAAADEKELVSV